MITVFPFESAEMACPTRTSLSGSANAVASSRIRIGAFFRTARAMAIRCCSPPERYTPFAPTTVSIPSGSFLIMSRHCAVSNALRTSSRDASGFAMRTFSSRDAFIRRLFWNTKDTVFISVSFGISRMSTFPISTRPF